MKKSLFALMALATIIVACNPNDPVRTDTDVVDQKEYGSVYMGQASHSPLTVNADKDNDQTTKVTVNAYLGGPDKYTADITVEFEVKQELVNPYNEGQNTSYLPVPAEALSATTGTGIIKAGELKSNDVDFTITLSELTGNKSYLLPVSIKSCSYEKVTENQTTCYFIINVTETIPADPRQLVYDFEKRANGWFLTAYSDLLFRDDDENSNLKVFARQEDGTYIYDSTPGQGWIISGSLLDPIIFVPPYTLTFRLNDTFQEFSFFNHYESWLGAFIGQAGWAPASAIFGFKDIAWLAVFGDALNYYNIQKVDNYDENHWVICSGQGTLATEGWSGYSKYFCYKNHIIAIDAQGVMYSWTLTDSLVLGEKVTMESGWEIYDYICACEDSHLLCVDQTGKVYKVDLDF